MTSQKGPGGNRAQNTETTARSYPSSRSYRQLSKAALTVSAIKAQIGLNEFARLLKSLGATKINPRTCRSDCPAHGGDSAEALHYSLLNGVVIWHCFTKNHSGDVINLVMEAQQVDFGGAVEWLVLNRFAKPTIPPPASELISTERYKIRDPDGKLVAVHVRQNLSNRTKRMWWERPDGSLGLAGLPLTELPLYGAEQLASEPVEGAVILVEGEKARDALKGREYLAVGTVTGATAAPSSNSLGLLRGREVILWPDNDDAGRRHMDRIAKALVGSAASVRVLSWGERLGDDAFDFFERGGTAKQLVGMIAEADACDGADLSSAATLVEVWTGRGLPRKSELFNAEVFVEEWRESTRWCPERAKWLLWPNAEGRWRWDDGTEAALRMKATIRRRIPRIASTLPDSERREIAYWALRSESANRIRASLELARSEPGTVIRLGDLDRDPWLLNAKNGTVDLRSGLLQSHRREDFLTRLAPVAYQPDLSCPGWDAFLKRIFADDAELIRFVRRAVGYSLTGLTDEQVLFFLFGSGANGKSKFLNVLEAILGSYAAATPIDTFFADRVGGPWNDVARLVGVRFVTAFEPEDGCRWAEGRVKLLTGGDTLSVRFLYGEFFDMRPVAKFWITSNHLPATAGGDAAFWRRLLVIPFTVVIPENERDPNIAEKLIAQEASGILNWCVAGALEWQAEGLNPPSTVRSAIDQYRCETDALGEFIETCCESGPDLRCLSNELYNCYTNWADAEGIKRPMSPTAFGRRMTERRYVREKVGGHRYRLGIRPRPGP